MSEEKVNLRGENCPAYEETVEDYPRETFMDKLVANSKIIIVGLGATAIMFIGAVMYTSAEEADPAQYGYSDSSTYGYQNTGQYGGQYGASSGQYSAQYAVQSNGATTGAAATGGGGCGGGGASTPGGGSGGGCGGGSASGGGGGCGGGGSSSGTSVAPAELEKQALEQYKAETGKTDVTVKVENRGCHTQIDVYDKTGKIVRSYGYQGGPLYVIS